MKLSNVDELAVAWAAKRVSQLDTNRTKEMAMKGFIEGFRTAVVMLESFEAKRVDMEPLPQDLTNRPTMGVGLVPAPVETEKRVKNEEVKEESV